MAAGRSSPPWNICWTLRASGTTSCWTWTAGWVRRAVSRLPSSPRHPTTCRSSRPSADSSAAWRTPPELSCWCSCVTSPDCHDAIMWHRSSSRRPSSLGWAALCSWSRSAPGRGRCAGWLTPAASSRCCWTPTDSFIKHSGLPGQSQRCGSTARCSTTAARRRRGARCRRPTPAWRTTRTRWAATS